MTYNWGERLENNVKIQSYHSHGQTHPEELCLTQQSVKNTNNATEKTSKIDR